MRILVFEFVSGGGLAGERLPPSLAREGAAMLRALVEDLEMTGEHQIVTTSDVRIPLAVPAGVEVIPFGGRGLDAAESTHFIG